MLREMKRGPASAGETWELSEADRAVMTWRGVTRWGARADSTTKGGVSRDRILDASDGSFASARDAVRRGDDKAEDVSSSKNYPFWFVGGVLGPALNGNLLSQPAK